MVDFGKRVKELRQLRDITKEAFCGDETELSVRQLTRIENGVSTPTLAKVIFIAQQLESQWVIWLMKIILSYQPATKN